MYRDDLPGPVPGEEVAVRPGCPAASAAEMKELIYLPESYNSLSTCIRTPSTPCRTLPRPSRSLSLSLSRSSTLSARLGSFSFSLVRCSPPFPSLSALSKFLAPSSSLPLTAGRRDYSPFCTFRALLLRAGTGTRSHNLRARLPVTYVDAFSRNLVSNLFSLVLSSLAYFHGSARYIYVTLLAFFAYVSMR